MADGILGEGNVSKCLKERPLHNPQLMISFSSSSKAGFISWISNFFNRIQLRRGEGGGGLGDVGDTHSRIYVSGEKDTIK